MLKIFKKKKKKEEEKESIPWELEVYRNTHNLCVYCGKPMVTTIFFDVPVCEEHAKDSNR